jgi:hypothetical protein
MHMQHHGHQLTWWVGGQYNKHEGGGVVGRSVGWVLVPFVSAGNYMSSSAVPQFYIGEGLAFFCQPKIFKLFLR